MFSPRRGAITFAMLGLPLLAGCGNSQHVGALAATGAVKTPMPQFSLDTPVDRIAANERGKAILERDLPGLMSNKSYVLFDDMSLSQIATVSGGRLTEAKLDAVQADLSQLSAPAP
jgi:hypothetical protein